MRHWKLKIFLLAFVLGGAWRVKEYRAWMPLSRYCVDAESSALEEQLWNFFPVRCISFWPWLIKDSDALCEFLERTIPVRASTEMDGFGRFKTTLKWLTPWVKIEWRGRVWCVSKEGRMWDASESIDSEFDAKIRGPMWHLAHMAEDGQPPPAGVFDSPFPMDTIAAFLDEYERCSWFGYVKDIAWDRRAGMDLFRMKVERDGQDLDVLLQSAKYNGQDVGAALEDVFSKLSREGGNYKVDATYEGKILVSSLSGGQDRPKEGSRK